jgi:polygalacturonase
VWYNTEAGKTIEGRPVPFVFSNTTSVHVSSFYTRYPVLWALNIMNITDMILKDIKVNAIATRAPYFSKWVQNTGGLDTMDARNVNLTSLWYQ